MRYKISLIIFAIAIIFWLGMTISCAPVDNNEEIIPEEEVEPVEEEAVSMDATSFIPETINIRAGTKVVWTNDDNLVHTVTSGVRGDDDAGSLFDSSNLSPGDTFEHTFEEPGTYDYFCTLHVGMDGQVVVE